MSMCHVFFCWTTSWFSPGRVRPEKSWIRESWWSLWLSLEANICDDHWSSQSIILYLFSLEEKYCVLRQMGSLLSRSPGGSRWPWESARMRKDTSPWRPRRRGSLPSTWWGVRALERDHLGRAWHNSAEGACCTFEKIWGGREEISQLWRIL